VYPLSRFIIAKRQIELARGEKKVVKMAMEQGVIIVLS
jgi:flagellar biosynthesis/type III secretory pathway ATPase